MSVDKKMDDFIREAFHEKWQQSSPPLSAEEAWEQIQKKRGKEKIGQKKHTISRLTMTVATFGILALATIMILSPQHGSAFTRWTSLFHEVQGSMIQIFGKVGGQNVAKHAPPPPSNEFQVVEESEMIPERMSLAEAQAVTSFPIVIPRVIPEGFELENVTVFRLQNGKEKSKDITLLFSQEQRSHFTITEMAVSDEFGFGGTVDKEDTVVETIQIYDREGTLLLFKNGQSRLIWITPSHFYAIEGDLTKEEIIEVAKSM